MPPTDPATIRLADCPVGAVVLWPPHGAQDAGFVETDDAEHWPDLSVRLIAPSLAALVARAEAGRVLADALSTERPWTELADALDAYRKATV